MVPDIVRPRRDYARLKVVSLLWSDNTLTSPRETRSIINWSVRADIAYRRDYAISFEFDGSKTLGKVDDPLIKLMKAIHEESLRVTKDTWLSYQFIYIHSKTSFAHNTDFLLIVQF